MLYSSHCSLHCLVRQRHLGMRIVLLAADETQTQNDNIVKCKQWRTSYNRGAVRCGGVAAGCWLPGPLQVPGRAAAVHLDLTLGRSAIRAIAPVITWNECLSLSAFPDTSYIFHAPGIVSRREVIQIFLINIKCLVLMTILLRQIARVHK